jgi:hypothetical protein
MNPAVVEQWRRVQALRGVKAPPLSLLALLLLLDLCSTIDVYGFRGGGLRTQRCGDGKKATQATWRYADVRPPPSKQCET